MTAVEETSLMTQTFKTLKETVLRERQAKADALVQELVSDKAEVIGTGPDAVDGLDAFLNG
jgi:hypothetical protein